MNASGSVLLDGRLTGARRNGMLAAVSTWLPVFLMILVVARESTAAFGSVNTSPILRLLYQALIGPVPDRSWEPIHHYLRKAGHFIGYGTLGVTWFRAYLIAWSLPLRHCAAMVWRRWSFQMAICCTCLIAACDEVHQSYIPDRTGLVTDVLLDTTGAVVFCGLLALLWTRTGVREAPGSWP